jgi:putative transposase
MVQTSRNKKAAKKFFRKLLKSLRYVPRMIITDKLRSYRGGKRGSDEECRTYSTKVSKQPR